MASVRLLTDTKNAKICCFIRQTWAECCEIRLFCLLLAYVSSYSFHLRALGDFCSSALLPLHLLSPPSFLPVTLKMISALRLDGCLDFQNASRREVRGERRLGWKRDSTGVSFGERIYKRGSWKKNTSQVGRTRRWGKELRTLCSSSSTSLITVQLTHLFQHTHLPSISSSVLRSNKPGASDQSVCWRGLKPPCDQFSSTCRPCSTTTSSPPVKLKQMTDAAVFQHLELCGQLGGLHTHGQMSCFRFQTEHPRKDWDQPSWFQLYNL